MRDDAGYAPISDYGFLSDCRSAALVATDGAVDWLCWPRFDSPSLFGRMLDHHRGGSFWVTPTKPYQVQRRYIEATNVLQTVFRTETGTVKVEDWLHAGARQALCRRIKGLDGDVELDVACDPRPEYGGEGPVLWSERMGYLVADLSDSVRLVLDGFEVSEESLIWVGDERRVVRPRMQLTVRAGEDHQLSLGLNRPGPSDLFSAKWRAIEFWRDWSEDLSLPDVAREHVLRSALVLKGLQYQPSGAIIAASTTSLPEDIGGERNYDYRFSWLRDSVFTLEALRAIGRDAEAQSYFDWLKAITLRSGTARLQIMYGVEGEADLPEHELAHLEGYKRSSPVRIGNAAADQRQLDTYGELADAIYHQRLRTKSKMGRHRAMLVKALAERAMNEWRDTDEGIWEVRGGARHFVYSKVMCWVALDRALKLAELDPQLFDGAPIGSWAREREAIRAQVLEEGFDEQLGAFTQSYRSGSLDASNLLLGRVGFIDPSDQRYVGTVRATQQHLMRGGLVDRYNVHDTNDGFSGEEGTFVICSLWLVSALISIGDLDGARKLFEHVVGHANDLGLLSEELTPDGEQLGNYPQAFSHIAIIICAYELAAAREQAALAAAR